MRICYIIVVGSKQSLMALVAPEVLYIFKTVPYCEQGSLPLDDQNTLLSFRPTRDPLHESVRSTHRSAEPI